MALTDRQMAMLDFARSWWTNDDPDAVIRERFGCSQERYREELDVLVDNDDALDHNPLVVHRLRRQRDRRRRLRHGAAANDASGGPAQ